MIDIHSHMLPGVDDGARSMDDALAMAEMAARSGVKIMAVTPHSNQPGAYQNYESKALRVTYRELKAAIAQEQIPLQLARGMEIFATGDIDSKVEQGELIPLNKSRYYLVEFAFDISPRFIEESLLKILRLGKVPVIAHPERYYCVQDHPDYLYRWRKMGALAQMNKGSIFGRFGEYSGRTAQILLEHRMVNCIASDAHGTKARTPDMREIKKFLDRHYSEDVGRLLLHVNPKCILMDKRLPRQAEPIPVNEKIRDW